MNFKEKLHWFGVMSLLTSSMLFATLPCYANDAVDDAADNPPAEPVASAPSSDIKTKTSTTATDEAEALKQFSSLLASAGIHYTLGGKNLTISIQQDNALANAPEVQSMGAINGAVTTTEMKMHPVEYASKVGLFYAIAIVQYLYLTPQTNDLHVSVDLISVENQNTITNQIATFDFTRSLNGKINYDKLNADTMPAEVPNFKYTEWYDKHK